MLVGEPFLLKLSLNSWPRPCRELTGLRIRFHPIQILFPCGLHLRRPPDVLPEFECKTGCLIECERCELRDHDRKFLGFLLVRTTQLLSKGPGGPWIKVECLATNDSWFLTWCDSHGGRPKS